MHEQGKDAPWGLRDLRVQVGRESQQHICSTHVVRGIVHKLLQVFINNFVRHKGSTFACLRLK